MPAIRRPTVPLPRSAGGASDRGNRDQRPIAPVVDEGGMAVFLEFEPIAVGVVCDPTHDHIVYGKVPTV